MLSDRSKDITDFKSQRLFDSPIPEVFCLGSVDCHIAKLVNFNLTVTVPNAVLISTVKQMILPVFFAI